MTLEKQNGRRIQSLRYFRLANEMFADEETAVGTIKVDPVLLHSRSNMIMTLGVVIYIQAVSSVDS
jgi:hypothetical protein